MYILSTNGSDELITSKQGNNIIYTCVDEQGKVAPVNATWVRSNISSIANAKLDKGSIVYSADKILNSKIPLIGVVDYGVILIQDVGDGYKEELPWFITVTAKNGVQLQVEVIDAPESNPTGMMIRPYSSTVIPIRDLTFRGFDEMLSMLIDSGYRDSIRNSYTKITQVLGLRLGLISITEPIAVIEVDKKRPGWFHYIDNIERSRQFRSVQPYCKMEIATAYYRIAGFEYLKDFQVNIDGHFEPMEAVKESKIYNKESEINPKVKVEDNLIPNKPSSDQDMSKKQTNNMLGMFSKIFRYTK